MLSIIFLSYHSGDRIRVAYQKLSLLLEEHRIPFEFLVVDDGSTDGSYALALELEQKHANVRAYQLSRNYTSHYSIFAGLSLCSGDCAIPIPDDEQQPYDTITEMYRLWERGNRIIIPYRIKRDDGAVPRLAANLYYRTINALSEVRFPRGGADIFFIDREIIDILNERIHHINTSSIIEVLRLGYDPYFFPFERTRGIRHRSRWTFRKKIRLFKDTFYSSSTWPVRIITRMGLFFSFLAFAMIIFYSCVTLSGNWEDWGKYVPGWTSTVVIISFFSGIILFSLGVIAEYIWRIYDEVKDRPGFIVKKKPEKGNPVKTNS